MITFAYDEKPSRFDLNIYAEGIKEWKTTKHKKQPYVLLGKLDLDAYSEDGGQTHKRRWKACVFPMWAGLFGSAPSDLQNFLNKGCVVLDSWIPENKDLPPIGERGGMPMDHGWALEYRSPEGQKRASELRAAVARAKGEIGAISQVSKERDAYAQKVKELEAKLSRGK